MQTNTAERPDTRAAAPAQATRRLDLRDTLAELLQRVVPGYLTVHGDSPLWIVVLDPHSGRALRDVHVPAESFAGPAWISATLARLHPVRTLSHARNALDRVASAFPGGEQLVTQILQVSREGLSNSLHDGFVFTLIAGTP